MTNDSSDTRAALLEAAIAVIDESGESGFRINAVLDRVGVASTAIYHHFGSRDDLVDSANAERYLRTLYIPNHAQFVEAIAACRSADEFYALVRRTMAVSSSPAATERRRIRISVLGSAVSRPTLAAKVHDANVSYARSMADAFAPAQERGWVDPDLDLRVSSMWQIGHSTGRLMSEIGGAVVDLDAWALIEIDSVVAILKGRVD